MSNPRKRPPRVPGVTVKEKLPCGACYVSVNRDNAGLCEVFLTVGRPDCKLLVDSLGRLISLYLKCGVPVELVAKAIRMPKCPAVDGNRNCTHVFADALREEAENLQQEDEEKMRQKIYLENQRKMVADFNAGFPQEGVKVRYWFRERGGAGALGTAKLPAEMNGAQAIVYIFGAGSFPLSHVEVIE